MKDNNCIFCKIANGDIPSRTIYENDLFRVILDNGPATDGHALVLPKDHYANLFEIPADTAAEAMKTAQTDFHMHIIPRYKGDGQNILWKPGHPSDQELDAVLARIKG